MGQNESQNNYKKIKSFIHATLNENNNKCIKGENLLKCITQAEKGLVLTAVFFYFIF
jgi:hypothetical protein